MTESSPSRAKSFGMLATHRLSGRDAATPAIAAFVGVTTLLGLARFLSQREVSDLVGNTAMYAGGLAPLLAAVGVAAWRSGRGGLRDLWSRVAHVRIRPRWYVLGLLVPAVVYASVLVAYAASGGGDPAFDEEVLWQIPQMLLVGPLFFVVEETGWRGWLQRALQSHLRPGVAALSVGVVWIVWHVPLLYAADTAQSHVSPPAFAALLLAVSIVFAWIYNATGGSVMAVVAAHVGFNLGIGPSVLALGEDATGYVTVCAVATAIAAVGLAVRTDGWLGIPSESYEQVTSPSR